MKQSLERSYGVDYCYRPSPGEWRLWRIGIKSLAEAQSEMRYLLSHSECGAARIVAREGSVIDERAATDAEEKP